jgi:putative phosphoesterase
MFEAIEARIRALAHRPPPSLLGQVQALHDLDRVAGPRITGDREIRVDSVAAMKRPRRIRMPPLRTREATLRRRDDGALRVVIVADTHSAPHPRSEALIRELAPDAIFHAGDIGDLSVLDGLARIAPVIAVRGNIDERAEELPDEVVVEVRTVRDELTLKILLTHIAVAGVRVRGDAAGRARDVGAGLIVCGHSHVPFFGKDRGVMVFNAGSIGPRRFGLPIVFGVMEIADGRLSLRHVDCETGGAWTPEAVVSRGA